MIRHQKGVDMTLKNRLLLTNLLMILSLAATGGASMWVIWVMAGSLSWVAGEYNELRLIDVANTDMAAVNVLLSSDQPDFERINNRLDDVLLSLNEWLKLQGGDEYGVRDEVTEKHQRSEQDTAASMIRTIEPIVTRLASYREYARPDPADIAESVQAIQRAKADMESLAYEADGAVLDAHERGHRAFRNAVMTLLSIGVFAVSITVFSSVWQYRSVVPPLARLRDRVREIASGRFDQRIVYRGQDEVADLAQEFNRMVAELEALYGDLERRVEIKSRQLVRSERLASAGFLAAGIAHEINNPLSIIAGHAELALKELRRRSSVALDTESIQGLEIIRDEAFRCKKIIEKLLSLIRSPDASRTTVRLDAIAHEVASLVRGIRQFNSRSLEIIIDDENPLTVMAQETEMKQLLLNLIINALEAVDENDGCVRITGRRDGMWMEVNVIDNGRGMSPEVLTRVFEPFYTEKRGAHERGNGLGLSIVHAIVQDHGGSIEAYSDGPGHGSRFTFRLPAAATQEREHAANTL